MAEGQGEVTTGLSSTRMPEKQSKITHPSHVRESRDKGNAYKTLRSPLEVKMN